MSCGARESSGSLFSSISSKIDTAENGCHKKITTDNIIVPLHTERVDAKGDDSTDDDKTLRDRTGDSCF